jgi:hypothetical protein
MFRGGGQESEQDHGGCRVLVRVAGRLRAEGRGGEGRDMLSGRLRMLALELDGHSYVIRGRLWFPFVLSGIVLNSLLRSTVLC